MSWKSPPYPTNLINSTCDWPEEFWWESKYELVWWWSYAGHYSQTYSWQQCRTYISSLTICSNCALPFIFFIIVQFNRTVLFHRTKTFNTAHRFLTHWPPRVPRCSLLQQIEPSLLKEEHKCLLRNSWYLILLNENGIMLAKILKMLKIRKALIYPLSGPKQAWRNLLTCKTT